MTQNKIQLSQNSFFPFVKKVSNFFCFVWHSSQRLPPSGWASDVCDSNSRVLRVLVALPAVWGLKMEAPFELAPWYTPPYWVLKFGSHNILQCRATLSTRSHCWNSTTLRPPVLKWHPEPPLISIPLCLHEPPIVWNIMRGDLRLACASLWYQLIHQTWFHNCIISVALENRSSCCLVLVCQWCCMIMTIDVVFCVKNCKYWLTSLADKCVYNYKYVKHERVYAVIFWWIYGLTAGS